jgi:hypothetical protein
MSDAAKTITVYNDNKSAVDWASSVTLKGTKHINLHECCVREQHQNKTVKVTHIPGVINSSDLFTKEIKDAAHFRRCRDSFMVSKANFMKYGHCVPSHLTAKEDLPYYSIMSPEPKAGFFWHWPHGQRSSDCLRQAVRQSIQEGGVAAKSASKFKFNFELRSSVCLSSHCKRETPIRTPI